MKNYILLVITCLIVFSCKENNKYNRVVLKINDLSVTEYELIRYINRNHTTRTDTLSAQAKLNIITDILNRYLIISEAYNYKYDTLRDFQDNISLISDFMLTQPNGYHWKEAVQPIIDEFKELTPDKLEKRSFIYYFDIIRTDNRKNLLEILDKDTLQNNKEEFQQLKKLCAKYPEISNKHVSAQWPFTQWHLLSDTLYNMQNGEVSSLFQHNGSYFIFFLNRKEQAQLSNQNSEEFIYDLQNYIEKVYKEEKIKEAMLNCKPVINYPAVDSVIEYLSRGHNIHTYPYNNVVLRYILNDSLKNITYHELIKVFRYLPFSSSFNTKKELLSTIDSYVYRAYLADESRKLGIYENATFKLDQKFYKNNVCYTTYLKNEIQDDIAIDSMEIVQYYQSHLELFKAPRYKYVHCFFFDSYSDAMKNWYTISSFYQNNSTSLKLDNSTIPELKATLEGYKIDMLKCEGFDPKETYNIHELRLGQLSLCLSFKGKHVLILNTKEEDSYQLGLDHVYQYLEGESKKRETNVKLSKKLEKLNASAKIDINEIEDCL